MPFDVEQIQYSTAPINTLLEAEVTVWTGRGYRRGDRYTSFPFLSLYLL